MKIKSVRAWQETIKLTAPFAIAYSTEDSVVIHFVEIVTQGGLTGFGSASPSSHVTGETEDSCAAALTTQAPGLLADEDVSHLPRLVRMLEERMPDNPAARAALEMALQDLFARQLKVPLVEMLGRCFLELPTSITIGIKNVDDTIREARENVSRGFRALKVKLGLDLGEDIEKLRKLREQHSREIAIRVDPNQGYTSEDLMFFCKETEDLELEFIEQPLAARAVEEMRRLPEEIRMRLAADESLLTTEDALNLLIPEPACGIFNIKLMKCGGILQGRKIAAVAEAARVPLMWGCNNESRLSIAAALHAALSCPNTSYLDLDGHLDLVRDPAGGGFSLESGMLRPLDAPGFGVRI